MPRQASLDIRPLTPRLMDDLGAVLRSGWGAGCWCMYPRLGDAATRALPGEGTQTERKRAAMEALARRRRAPGLIAFDHGEPVGWVAVAPRAEFRRIASSRATPPFDDADVWVIPCLTITPSARGQGITVALIKAAVAFAHAHGASIVEAYPRAGDRRAPAGSAYFGTEPMFARAGFKTVRGPLANRPKSWLPRLVMRIETRA